MPYAIRPATEADVPQLAEIEKEGFPTTWPPTPFKRELSNSVASFLVAHALPVNGRPPTATLQEPAHTSAGPQPRGLTGLLLRLFRSKTFASLPADPAEYIAGYVATWFMTDEAHITSIAVRESLRGIGLGELLVIACVELAMKRQSRVVTLEVRVSNDVAQSLYVKYGFKEVGRRKGYYTDNHEDALIMTTDPIPSDAYRVMFRGLVEAYKARHGEVALALG